MVQHHLSEGKGSVNGLELERFELYRAGASARFPHMVSHDYAAVYEIGCALETLESNVSSGPIPALFTQ